MPIMIEAWWKQGDVALGRWLRAEQPELLGVREKLAMGSETSDPIPRDTPPPARPHLLILPKQFHQLGTKYLDGLQGPFPFRQPQGDSPFFLFYYYMISQNLFGTF